MPRLNKVSTMQSTIYQVLTETYMAMHSKRSDNGNENHNMMLGVVTTGFLAGLENFQIMFWGP